MTDTGYVAVAYLVFLALVLIYVGIMAAKLSRIARDVEAVAQAATREPEPAESEAVVR